MNERNRALSACVLAVGLWAASAAADPMDDYYRDCAGPLGWLDVMPGCEALAARLEALGLPDSAAWLARILARHVVDKDDAAFCSQLGRYLEVHPDHPQALYSQALSCVNDFDERNAQLLRALEIARNSTRPSTAWSFSPGTAAKSGSIPKHWPVTGACCTRSRKAALPRRRRSCRPPARRPWSGRICLQSPATSSTRPLVWGTPGPRRRSGNGSAGTPAWTRSTLAATSPAPDGRTAPGAVGVTACTWPANRSCCPLDWWMFACPPWRPWRCRGVVGDRGVWSSEHHRVHAQGFLGDEARLAGLRRALQVDSGNETARCDLAAALAARGRSGEAADVLGSGDPSCLEYAQSLGWGFAWGDRDNFGVWQEKQRPVDLGADR